jgi:starch phosphorylase
VARLHSELVKHSLLRDFYELFPERFNNKTNGVTPRRWVLYANPRLTELLSSKIGPDWIDKDLRELTKITALADDDAFLEELMAVKQANKRDLARLVQEKLSVEIPEEAIFIVQVKRIHEYKRQLLLALHIIAQYAELKRNPDAPFVPRCYIFAGKAAPGYHLAKLHIRLINDIAEVIDKDPEVRGKLSVAFIPNYGVSLAQTIIPAADLSVQISTAGKEASGTGNMKFALNGALTVGTLDGANVEIREEVGPENFFLFGLTVDEVEALKHDGYYPQGYIDRTPALAEALALIDSGFFSFGDPDRFKEITDQLKSYDPYFVCADFDGFQKSEAEAANAYLNPQKWARHALLNIAGASRFSSDYTVRQYADEIWGLRSVKVNVERVRTT